MWPLARNCQRLSTILFSTGSANSRTCSSPISETCPLGPLVIIPLIGVDLLGVLHQLLHIFSFGRLEHVLQCVVVLQSSLHSVSFKRFAQEVTFYRTIAIALQTAL